MKVLVVGAGLFGSVAAAMLRQRGHEVTVVDEGLPNTASRAAGCVLAPSWAGSLTRAGWAEAMRLLRSLYPVREVEFQTNLKASFKAFHIDPDKILVREYVTGTYGGFAGKTAYLRGRCAGERFQVEADAIYVATGAKALDERLSLGHLKRKVLWGASLRIPTPRAEAKELVTLYAPYKQAVCVRTGSGYWFGDGTALSEKTWVAEKDQRIKLLRIRAEELGGLDLSNGCDVRYGGRPVLDAHPGGILFRLSHREWLGTGGGKNGTLAAALIAAQFLAKLEIHHTDLVG